MLKNSLLILLILCLQACASFSGERIEGIKKPIKFVRFVISQSFPGGKPTVADKGMAFTSKPFGISRGEPTDYLGRKYRYIAKVYIRGAEQPYDLDIEAFREVRVGKNKYRALDTDQRVAKMIAKTIQKELTKRRKGLNIIDDFRVF